MLLSPASFQALPLSDQLGAVLSQGTHLTTHYAARAMCMLYYLDGFLVKIHYDLLDNYVHQCRSFTHIAELEDYLPYVKLTDIE